MTSTAPIRVLAADDHPLMRNGVAALLSPISDIELVAEAVDGQDAIEQFRTHRPDVTLMDLQMPRVDGVEAMNSIRKDFPSARVLILTTYKGDFRALAALKSGACGYLLKSSLMDHLVEAIRVVHSGRRYIPPEVAMDIAEHAIEDMLSEREIGVLQQIALGCSNKQVAAKLFISEETVKGHVRNILDKLGANDRTHAVTIAIRRGIILV